MLAFEAAVGLDAFEKSGILVFHNRGYHKKCTIYMYVEVSQQCYGFNFHYGLIVSVAHQSRVGLPYGDF